MSQVSTAHPQASTVHVLLLTISACCSQCSVKDVGFDHCIAVGGSKVPPLPPSSVHRPSPRSNPTSRLAASQHHPPQCIITPANAVSKKPPQLPPHAFQTLPHIHPHTGHALPRTPPEGGNLRPRQSRADNAENDFLAHLQSPASTQMGSHTVQKRRKHKRPQWQDVSIDLSAIQAARKQAGLTMSHADRPVGPSLSTDTAGAAHMSGVSPASPSPPKQHPQNIPFPQHKSRSSVPTLPALASGGSCLPEALAAWHNNVDQQRHHHQQHQHRLGQNVGDPLPFASGPFYASQRQQSSQAQLPNCLPPLHHQPHASPQALGLQSSADFAPWQSQYATQVPQVPQHRSCSRDRQGTHTPPLSASHHTLQASDDALPSTSGHRAEGPHGFAPAHSGHVAYEDPRSAQHVPLQYMRHPCGPGAPGGLHRLHRLLRPIARSQQQAASSSSVGEASNTPWAANVAAELPQHGDETSQQAAAAEPDAMQHPRHAQQSHDDQRKSSLEQQSKPVVMHQQPALQACAAHHTASSGWQEHGVNGQQHQQGIPVETAGDDTGSSDPQGAGDMQDVNMRLQQVLAICIYKWQDGALYATLQAISKSSLMYRFTSSLYIVIGICT